MKHVSVVFTHAATAFAALVLVLGVPWHTPTSKGGSRSQVLVVAADARPPARAPPVRLAILTAYFGSSEALDTLRNKQQYAVRHGYHFENALDDPFVATEIRSLVAAINGDQHAGVSLCAHGAVDSAARRSR